MSAIAGLIPVTAKAVNVCSYCRVRKQRCDRTLPQCQRCAMKEKRCDYTPYKDPTRSGDTELESLVITFEGCSHVDLSSRGTTELLRTVTAAVDSKGASDIEKKLSQIVYDILDLADVDISLALEEFGPCIQQWCPILPGDSLQRWLDILPYQHPQHEQLHHPHLLLCIWLISRRPCENIEHRTHSQLYHALKQSLALIQCDTNLDASALQLAMLLSAYEASQGMSHQAFQTMATSAALLRLLEHSATDNADLTSTLEWMKPSLLMLDRIIVLTSLTNLPLTLPSAHTISQFISDNLAPEIPPHPPFSSASAISPRKLHIRSTVALATGPALEYIASLTTNPLLLSKRPPTSHLYDIATSTLTSCIQALVYKPEPHTWLHCDAIALAFCTNILLQEAQIRHLISNWTVLAESPDPEYEKVHLALKYARRMAWDMVRVAISKIDGEDGMERLPFAGLCCVIRAGLAVVETEQFFMGKDGEEVKGEVEGFRRIVGSFKARWGAGGQYMERLEKIL